MFGYSYKLPLYLYDKTNIVENSKTMHDRVRNSIIQVARDVFSRFGFRKTTMEEIAQATRKGKSSIYYYFKSKEEIFEAVVETEARLLENEIMDSVNATEDPLNKLRHYILTRIHGFKKLGNFYDAMKNDFLNNLGFIEQIRADYDKKEVNVLTGILQEGIDKQEFQMEDPRRSSVALVTILKGLEIPLLIDQFDYQLEDRIEDLLKLFYEGIKKR